VPELDEIYLSETPKLGKQVKEVYGIMEKFFKATLK
jgi:hypothetical protein